MNKPLATTLIKRDLSRHAVIIIDRTKEEKYGILLVREVATGLEYHVDHRDLKGPWVEVAPK